MSPRPLLLEGRFDLIAHNPGKGDVVYSGKCFVSWERQMSMLSSLCRSLSSCCFVVKSYAFYCRIHSICQQWWFRDKPAYKRLGGCSCSSGKATGACPMTCAGYDVGYFAGEAWAGWKVGGAAVVANEWQDFGSNRAVAASSGDSVVVPGVLMEVEKGCWHACNCFELACWRFAGEGCFGLQFSKAVVVFKTHGVVLKHTDGLLADSVCCLRDKSTGLQRAVCNVTLACLLLVYFSSQAFKRNAFPAFCRNLSFFLNEKVSS